MFIVHGGRTLRHLLLMPSHFNWQDVYLANVFPHLSLLGRSIRKLQGDTAEVIVAAPLWLRQLWLPNLLRSLVRVLLLLPDTIRILSLTHS